MGTEPKRLMGHALRALPGVPGIWASDVHPVTYTSVALVERPHYDETRFLGELWVGRTLIARAIGATVADVEDAMSADMRRRLLGEAISRSAA